MPTILPLSELHTLSTAQRLQQHRERSVAATREALRRIVADKRRQDGERRLAAYKAANEASQIADLAHDRASSTQIRCARKVADCG